jgi:hypothetical protein
MKTDDKIVAMEEILERLINENSNINKTSTDYFNRLDIMMRLQETINNLRQLVRLREMGIRKDTY